MVDPICSNCPHPCNKKWQLAYAQTVCKEGRKEVHWKLSKVKLHILKLLHTKVVLDVTARTSTNVRTIRYILNTIWRNNKFNVSAVERSGAHHDCVRLRRRLCGSLSPHLRRSVVGVRRTDFKEKSQTKATTVDSTKPIWSYGNLTVIHCPKIRNK